MTKGKFISQGNAITKAKYELTATQKNILYMVMAQLKANDKPEKNYYISVKEIEDKTQSTLKYSQIRDSIDGFMTKIIEIKKENGNILRSTFFSSAEYIKGKGIVELGLDPKLRPYFFDLKNRFTKFQLEMALSIKSKFSKRIYEMLSQYKNFDSWSITVQELKERLLIVDLKTGKDSYPKWSLFEKRVLKKAQYELNEFTDISFDYEPIKRGRKYHEIVFSINYREYQSRIDYTDQESQILDRLINKYSLRKDQAIRVLDNHQIAEINKTLYEIQLKKPNNIGAYTAKIFDVN